MDTPIATLLKHIFTRLDNLQNKKKKDNYICGSKIFIHMTPIDLSPDCSGAVKTKLK